MVDNVEDFLNDYIIAPQVSVSEIIEINVTNGLGFKSYSDYLEIGGSPIKVNRDFIKDCLYDMNLRTLNTVKPISSEAKKFFSNLKEDIHEIMDAIPWNVEA